MNRHREELEKQTIREEKRTRKQSDKTKWLRNNQRKQGDPENGQWDKKKTALTLDKIRKWKVREDQNWAITHNTNTDEGTHLRLPHELTAKPRLVLLFCYARTGEEQKVIYRGEGHRGGRGEGVEWGPALDAVCWLNWWLDEAIKYESIRRTRWCLRWERGSGYSQGGEGKWR